MTILMIAWMVMAAFPSFVRAQCTCPPDWVDDVCGGGATITCTVQEMHQTRTCNPPACDIEEQCVADDSCIAYKDIGLRVRQGNGIVAIAVEDGSMNSPVRIQKGSTTYAVGIVDPGDPAETGIRVSVPETKALRKLPPVCGNGSCEVGEVGANCVVCPGCTVCAADCAACQVCSCQWTSGACSGNNRWWTGVCSPAGCPCEASDPDQCRTGWYPDNTCNACTPTTSCAAQGVTCGTIWNGCANETCGDPCPGCDCTAPEFMSCGCGSDPFVPRNTCTPSGCSEICGSYDAYSGTHCKCLNGSTTITFNAPSTWTGNVGVDVTVRRNPFVNSVPFGCSLYVDGAAKWGFNPSGYDDQTGQEWWGPSYFDSTELSNGSHSIKVGCTCSNTNPYPRVEHFSSSITINVAN